MKTETIEELKEYVDEQSESTSMVLSKNALLLILNELIALRKEVNTL